MASDEVAENRVRVTGARLCERPERLKVAGFYALPGAIVDAEIGFAGAHSLRRAREAGEVLRLRLSDLGVDAELVGLSASWSAVEATEARLERFAELIGIAIASTDAQETVRLLADEQAALRRVAVAVDTSPIGPTR